MGVLEKVEGGSKRISPMSFVAKQDGSMRLVADLVHLNKYVKRPVHPFTEVLNENGPFAHLWSKMLIFKGAIYKLIVLPHFCPPHTFLTTNESFQMRYYVRIFLKGHANYQE